MQLTSLTLWEKKKKSLNNSHLLQIKTSRMSTGDTKVERDVQKILSEPAFELPRASSWFSPVLLSARPTSDPDKQPMLLLPFLKEHFFLVTCATNCLHRQKYRYKALQSTLLFSLLPNPDMLTQCCQTE